MNTFMQHVRRPVRWLLGVLLIALAVSILCVCLGQMLSVGDANKNIENEFISLAFPSDTYSKDTDEWLTAYMNSHPNVVKKINSASLATAYISQLCPDNITDRIHDDHSGELPFDPYDSVIFEVTLTNIGRYKTGGGYVTDASGGVVPSDEPIRYHCDMEATVDRVIAMESGYSDPTGFTARMSFTADLSEHIDELGLEVGDKYLVYGSDYVDLDYLLRNELSKVKKMELCEAFDHSFYQAYNGHNYAARVKYGDLYTGISRSQLEYYRSVRFTLQNSAALVDNADAGYVEKYSNPFIVRLDESADDFLASENGKEWAELVRRIEINNHAFAIVGTDGVFGLTHFARANARIVSGRDMTDEEMASGARVCLISEAVASKNGISVGDKISLSFYEKDMSYPFENKIDAMSANPMAAHFGPQSQLLSEEKFEVIGIYAKGNEWALPEIDPYGFTPNTVFVPQTSISVGVEQSHLGMFRNFVVANEHLATLAGALADAGYDEDVLFDDNGYAEIKENLSAYEGTADRILPLALIAWAVVATLFIMLYPCREGAVLVSMDSLGCPRGDRISHLIKWTLCVTVPGSIVGAIMGVALWDTVIGTLASFGGAEISIEINYAYFAAIAVSQLAVVTLTVAIVALPLTRPRGLDRR